MKVHRLAPQRDDSLSSRTASEDSEFGQQSDGDTFQPSREPDYAQQFSHRDPMQLTRLALAKLTTASPTQLNIHVCSAMSGESKRITQSVQIKSTIFHLRDEINAAFAKPPGTPLQIFLGQRLLPVGSFRLVDFLPDYPRSAKVLLHVVWLSCT